MKKVYRMTEQQFEQVLRDKLKKNKLNEMEDSEGMSKEEFEAFKAWENYIQLIHDLAEVSVSFRYLPHYHMETIKGKEDYERLGIDGLDVEEASIHEYVGYLLTSLLNGEYDEFSRNKNMLQFRISLDRESGDISRAIDYAKVGFEAYDKYEDIGNRPDNSRPGLYWALGWLFNAATTGTIDVNNLKFNRVMKAQYDAYKKPGNEMYGNSLNENSYEGDSDDDKMMKLIKASILASEICNAGGSVNDNPFDKDSQYAEHNIFIDAFELCQRRNKRKSRPKKS